MFTSSGRRLRASVVVISWTSYGNGNAFSVMLLVYVTYIAFAPRSGPGELLEAGVQLADVALGLGLHQHAAQDPGPVTVQLDAGMAAGEVAGRHAEGAEVHRVSLVGHALGQHPGAGLVDRRQALRAGGREVADDVQLRALVELQPIGIRDQLRPAQGSPAAGRQHLAEPVRPRRQKPEREPQRGRRRPGPGALEADLAEVPLVGGETGVGGVVQVEAPHVRSPV